MNKIIVLMVGVLIFSSMLGCISKEDKARYESFCVSKGMKLSNYANFPYLCYKDNNGIFETYAIHDIQDANLIYLTRTPQYDNIQLYKVEKYES